MPTEPDAANWQPPPAQLSLPRHEVHVWRAPLDQPHRLDDLFATLAPDEQQRAARLRQTQDRERFIVARGSLRTLLGLYLNRPPVSLVFRYSAHGKPGLAEAMSTDVRFNLSHSQGLALFAFSRGRDLGIDLESMRREVAAEQVAERFFSAAETAALRALPAAQQAEAFFDYWTRKEAYIKARGEGLARLDAAAEEIEAAGWSLIELAPGAGFKAALVVEGRDFRLRCWQG
jgi:4'-phosphopantetheinyl transferase